MCFWHREGLTQACRSQELLTQMCPWTGKGLLTPYQASLKLSSSLSLSLDLVPHSGQVMSHWCLSLRLWSAELVGCSSASPKG